MESESSWRKKNKQRDSVSSHVLGPAWQELRGDWWKDKTWPLPRPPAQESVSQTPGGPGSL